MTNEAFRASVNDALIAAGLQPLLDAVPSIPPRPDTPVSRWVNGIRAMDAELKRRNGRVVR